MAVSVPLCRAVRSTPQALLARLPSGREKWVPVSQLHDDSEVYRAATAEDREPGKLVVSSWWANLPEQKAFLNETGAVEKED